MVNIEKDGLTKVYREQDHCIPYSPYVASAHMVTSPSLQKYFHIFFKNFRLIDFTTSASAVSGNTIPPITLHRSAGRLSEWEGKV